MIMHVADAQWVHIISSFGLFNTGQRSKASFKVHRKVKIKKSRNYSSIIIYREHMHAA